MRTGTEHLHDDNHPETAFAISSLPAAPARATLQSWKEIATELNRGVRTVQRWERDFGLPVRRIGRSRRAPVFAFKKELHSWLRTSTGIRARGTNVSVRPDVEGTSARNTDLLQALEKLFAGMPSMRGKCSDCGSRMQFLKGQFWIYGSSRRRSLSVPFCPQCNSDTRHAVGGYECIQ